MPARFLPMIFQRFFDDKLAQASYLVGCVATGEAAVVDANRDVEPYVRAAEREGLRIVAVTETHIHADYLSGSRELAARTGAKLHLSDCGPADWKYGFARSDQARLLGDGDEIAVGNVRLRAIHTPGHTPEHLSFFIIDGAATPEPMGVITGDFVFCGDVGRPDLLEKAVHVRGSAEAAAKTLWQSLQKFRAWPDHLSLWPGHGAGSACGKGMSSVPSSTVGYEKRVNWAFQAKDERAFIDGVLAGQPEPPAYFATMKRLNKEGPRVLGGVRVPELLDFSQLRVASHESRVSDAGSQAARQASATNSQLATRNSPILVDLRSAADFAAGHIPGSLSIPLNKSFTTWAGSLLPYDRDIELIFPDRDAAGLREAVRDLALIGLDRIAGYWTVDAIDWWRDQGRPLMTVAQLEPRDLARGGYTVVDVRAASEWVEGHLKGAIHIPLPELEARLGEVPVGGPLVLQCAGGGRSMIAASLLQAHGIAGVANLTGGYGAWLRAGLPTEK